jgi:hypothetical protein
MRTSENSVNGEVRRITLPGTSVNKGKKPRDRDPVEPRPDDAYSYQPPPEPLQYPAFGNTH